MGGCCKVNQCLESLQQQICRLERCVLTSNGSCNVASQSQIDELRIELELLKECACPCEDVSISECVFNFAPDISKQPVDSFINPVSIIYSAKIDRPVTLYPKITFKKKCNDEDEFIVYPAAGKSNIIYIFVCSIK